MEQLMQFLFSAGWTHRETLTNLANLVSSSGVTKPTATVTQLTRSPCKVSVSGSPETSVTGFDCSYPHEVGPPPLLRCPENSGSQGQVDQTDSHQSVSWC